MATIVCDLDGVVYVGSDPIPGAPAALEELRAQGRRILYVTNNSTKTPRMVVDTIERLTSLEVAEADVVTSGLVTALALKGRVDRVLILGGTALSDTFRSAGFTVVPDWQDAEAVVSGMKWDLTYDDLAAATLAIRAGAMFYATNTDATFPTAEGQKPGGGAIAAALETATGVSPIVCGKPHTPVGDAVLAVAGPGDILVVGDRLETDIALGKSQGWLTALVLSGVTTSGHDLPPGLEPDIVVDSLEDLPAVLAGGQTR